MHAKIGVRRIKISSGSIDRFGDRSRGVAGTSSRSQTHFRCRAHGITRPVSYRSIQVWIETTRRGTAIYVYSPRVDHSCPCKLTSPHSCQGNIDKAIAGDSAVDRSAGAVWYGEPAGVYHPLSDLPAPGQLSPACISK